MTSLRRADLAGVLLGEGRPVAVMGVVNVSPESFHEGSVRTDREALAAAALAMVEAGAACIDVGARSTAPYLPTTIDEDEERERLGRAVEVLTAVLPVPVSADTARPGPARAALEAGARIVNDVSGLADPVVGRLAAAYGAGVVLMASPGTGGGAIAEPREAVDTVHALLQAALARARAASIPDERVVLDPGIGFFRAERLPWHEWDVRVLGGLSRLAVLGRPLCVGVSRKSFIGVLTGQSAPADRLSGSLAATVAAVWGGAALVRTHDVRETLAAVRVAEHLREAARAPMPV